MRNFTLDFLGCDFGENPLVKLVSFTKGFSPKSQPQKTKVKFLIGKKKLGIFLDHYIALKFYEEAIFRILGAI